MSDLLYKFTSEKKNAPHCITHYTDQHNSDNERITLAFDIMLIKNNNNFEFLYER